MLGTKSVKKRFQIVVIGKRFWYYVRSKGSKVSQKVSIGNVGLRVAVTQKSKSFRVDLFAG